jgi:hypothetical protein
MKAARRALGWVAMGLIFSVACDRESRGGAADSSRTGGVAMGKPSGLEVMHSSAPKITEAQFMGALDARLDAIVKEMRGKEYRSRMHIAADLSSRMQPKQILADVRKDMGASDVSVLSLFARQPDVRKKVGKRVERRAAEVGKELKELHESLPMVVEEDCKEAAARSLSLKEVAAGKRQASVEDRQAAPLVAAVLEECKKAAEASPELKCFVEAKTPDALKACR